MDIDVAAQRTAQHVLDLRQSLGEIDRYSSSAQDAVGRGFAVLQKPYDLAGVQRALRELRGTPEPVPQRAVG